MRISSGWNKSLITLRIDCFKTNGRIKWAQFADVWTIISFFFIQALTCGQQIIILTLKWVRSCHWVTKLLETILPYYLWTSPNLFIEECDGHGHHTNISHFGVYYIWFVYLICCVVIFPIFYHTPILWYIWFFCLVCCVVRFSIFYYALIL